HVADLVGLEHRNAPRLLSVTAGIVTAVAVYWIGVQIMDRGRARLAGGLAAISGVLLWTTGPLTGDGPAAALITTAVGLAVSYRGAPSRAKAVGFMTLAGLAVATKSLVVAPALLIGWILIAMRRRWLDTVLIPVGALVIVVALSIPWGMQHVIDDYLRYHLDKTANRKPFSNLNRLVRAFVERDTVLVSLGILGAGVAGWSGIRHRTNRSGPPSLPRRADIRFVWWWAGIALVVLLAQDPMFRNHLSALVAPFVLLAARYRPPWRVGAIALLAIPLQFSTLRPLLTPHDYRRPAATVIDAIGTLPPNAWALSDNPGLVWRAGRGTDPFFVDPSVLRIESTVKSIRITEGRILKAARRSRVCAVIVTAPERFGRYPDLPDRLERLGYERTIDLGGRLGLYRRPACHP
ncbi:MAG: glycosyltransferase family 39 protein, partial [Acidimicrobiia bacterium]|nr:glycosyltransferase family 39 protein [Acidimicrobiia bacterium]